jgi:hypothetical protein
MKTHGPVVGGPAFWFAMLRPLIGLIIGFLGSWVVGETRNSKNLNLENY